MGSKRKPKRHSKLQVKKSKIQNLQNFTMPTIFDRFPTLSDDIFEILDEESLSNCVEVNRKWQATVANQKVYLKKKVRKWSNNSKEFSKEWSIALVKIPVDLLRRLSEYIMEHRYFECNYKPINNGDNCFCIFDYKPSSIEEENHYCKCLQLSPIHVAALHGNIDLFRHIETKTEQEPKNLPSKDPSPSCCPELTELSLFLRNYSHNIEN